MEAPIWVSGSMMRPMGRFWMEASPVSVLSKACPLKIPAIRRVVVPLLPASRIWEGAERP